MAETTTSFEGDALSTSTEETSAFEEALLSNADSRHLVAQKKRAQSSMKWWVLLDVFVGWMSSWFTTFSASALETTLLESLHWDSSQYSYVVACTFCGAIVGPFLLPLFDYVLKRAAPDILSSNHLSQSLMIIGQCAFALLIEAYHSNPNESYFALILLSRIVIGLGMGSADAKCQGTISFWFGASERVNEAFGILIIGIELGMMASRVAFPPFYDLFSESSFAMALPFLLALSVPMFSCSVSLFVHQKLRISEFAEEQRAPLERGDEAECDAMSPLRQFAGFSPTIWVVIAVVTLVNAVITVLYSCFEDPLHETFKLSEYNSDLVLSMSALSIIAFIFPASWVMDYCGGIAYWIWLYSTSTVVAMGMMAVPAVVSETGVHVKHIQNYGVSAIALFAIMIPFENIYGLQAIASPPQHAQLIASTTTVLFWTLSIVITNGFGWIRDTDGDYSNALMLMFALSVLTWLLNTVLIVMDRKVKGPLTKLTDHILSASSDADGESEPLLVNV